MLMLNDSRYNLRHETSSPSELHHYIGTLRKHGILIILISMLTFLLALAYTFLTPPIYRSHATLLIEPQRTNVATFEEYMGIETDTADYYKTQFELLQSRSLAADVIDTLELWSHPELTPETQPSGFFLINMFSGFRSRLENRTHNITQPDNASVESIASETIIEDDSFETGLAIADMEEVETSGAVPATGGVDKKGSKTLSSARQERIIDNFLERLEIKPKESTSLVSVIFESYDPVLASEVANTLGERYIISFLDSRLSRTERAAEWLASRVTDLKLVLEGAEQRLLDFKRENGLIVFDGGVGRLSEQELILATQELGNARIELDEAGRKFRQLEPFGESPELLLSTPSAQLDLILQRIKLNEAEASRRLDTLLNRYGPKHPSVLDVQSSLDSIRAELRSSAQRLLDNAAAELRSAQQRYNAAQAKLDSGKQELQLIGEQRYDLEALEREVETNLGVYETFYNRMTELRSADGLEAANATISDLAVPPEEPVKPRKTWILLLSTVAAFLITSGLVFLREFMDDSVNGANDVFRKLGTPLLGLVPAVHRGLFSNSRSMPIISDQKNDHAFVESIKALRTTMMLADNDRSNKLIVVTSSVPGEGKSSLSLNLAQSFGEVEKVLLIDGDLRRPTLRPSRSYPEGGLSSLIVGAVRFKNCIYQEQFGGKSSIDVMPAGPISDVPLELLHSASFKAFLDILRKRYDRIVIDSAPVKAVSDSLVLAKLADSTVFVVKAHSTPSLVAKRCLQKLWDINATIAGVVVTQAKPGKTSPYEFDYVYSEYHGQSGGPKSGYARSRLTLSEGQLERIRGSR